MGSDCGRVSNWVLAIFSSLMETFCWCCPFCHQLGSEIALQEYPSLKVLKTKVLVSCSVALNMHPLPYAYLVAGYVYCANSQPLSCLSGSIIDRRLVASSRIPIGSQERSVDFRPSHLDWAYTVEHHSPQRSAQRLPQICYFLWRPEERLPHSLFHQSLHHWQWNYWNVIVQCNYNHYAHWCCRNAHETNPIPRQFPYNCFLIDYGMWQTVLSDDDQLRP